MIEYNEERPHDALNDLTPWEYLSNGKFGRQHHGYFLPSEGANNVALALFSFPSLAAYETYRTDSFKDKECIAAFQFAEGTNCITSYERSFFRPVLD